MPRILCMTTVESWTFEFKMVSIYKLKPKFQQLLKPVLVSLHKANISANQITLASIFSSFVIGILFWFGDVNHFLFLALPVGFFLRMALNTLDAFQT